MPYDFAKLKEKIKETEERLARELSLVRTGRATPAILDGVRVDSYGAKVPVNHVAGITTEDAKTLRITPWDKVQIKNVQDAINAADLGLSVAVDEQGIRAVFPELTAERRAALSKIVGAKLEEARVSLRRIRDDVWGSIQEDEKRGALSEDEKFRAKEEMEGQIGESNKRLEEAGGKKEKELAS